MKQHFRWTRRQFLKRVALGAGGLFVSGGVAGFLSGCSSTRQTEYQQQIDPVSVTPAATLGQTLEVTLAAVQAEESIFNGPKTKVWRYQASVVEGDPGALQEMPGSYLGPIFRVKKGQHVRVNLVNQLTEPTIIHWHGLHLSQEMDGHPMYAVQPGKSYQYDFRVADRAGTYWFHPHPDQLTGPQVYRGLAGLFLVSDDEEAEAGLPVGEYDVPLIIQDRMISGDNQFVYLPGGAAERMSGMLGDRILVNGLPDFVLSTAATAYRLRILNGSNSRIYKLAWEDGTPLTVIGTDGGLLEAPIQRPYVVLGPAERIELWVDFDGRALGSQLRLVSLAFSAGSLGMMGMMGGQSSIANGDPFPVMTVRVEKEGPGIKSVLPSKLSTIQRYQEQDAINYRQPRTFTLGMGGMGGMMGGGMGMGWSINGKTFELHGVAQGEIVMLSTLELWVYDNQSGGMGGMMGGGMMGGMMQMVHPMHIHGLQFQILGWEVDPAVRSMWDTLREGFVTEGWKDTVLVMPGTRAKLLLKFQDFKGVFLPIPSPK